MKFQIMPIILKTAFIAGCLSLPLGLSAEQTLLLLQSRDQTALLSLPSKEFAPLLKNTDYLQASETGKIVYRSSEKSDWKCAEISLKNGKPELVSMENPAELTNQDKFPTFSPDGSKLLWARYGEVKSILNVWDFAAKKVTFSKEINGYVYLPEWSPDGKKLAFFLKEKSPVFTKDDYGFAIWNSATDELLQFPVSKPTRPSPQRDWRPMWSNNSQYVFYEGRYDVSKNHFEVLIDTLSGKQYSCEAGLLVNETDVLYLSHSAGSLNIFLNPVTEVLKEKFSLKNPIGKINALSFMAVRFDPQTNTLYFQPSNRIVSAFHLKENKEEVLCKVDFNIQSMSIIRK